MRAKIFVHFIGQCWYFNRQWTAGQAINKGELCLEQHYSLKELCRCYVSSYKSGYLEGFGRWRGPFWLHRETLTFMCPAAYLNTAVIQIGANKIRTNFDTLFVMSLYGVRLFKGLRAQCIYMSFGIKGLIVVAKQCSYSQQNVIFTEILWGKKFLWSGIVSFPVYSIVFW
jgi:hypothetical protein